MAMLFDCNRPKARKHFNKLAPSWTRMWSAEGTSMRRSAASWKARHKRGLDWSLKYVL